MPMQKTMFKSSGFLFCFFYIIFCTLQVATDNQALLPILQLLTAEETKKSILREACWTISNIAAGTKKQIQVEMVLVYMLLQVSSHLT